MKIKKSYTKKVKTFAEVAKIFRCTWSCHGETDRFVNEFFKGENAAILVASNTFGGRRVVEKNEKSKVYFLTERIYADGEIVIVLEDPLGDNTLRAQIDGKNKWEVIPFVEKGLQRPWVNGVSGWSILQEFNFKSYLATSGSSGSILKCKRNKKGNMKVTYTPPVCNGVKGEYKGTYRKYFMGEAE